MPASIDTNARRVVKSQLQTVVDPHLPPQKAKAYVLDLERSLLRIWHFSQDEYVAHARRLVYNLGQNGEHLLPNHPPAVLVALDNDHLAEGTPIAQKRQEHDARRQEFASQIAMEMDRPLLFDTTDTALRCPFCKSHNVLTMSIQKRSADEGASNYGECQDCDRRFPINS